MMPHQVMCCKSHTEEVGRDSSARTLFHLIHHAIDLPCTRARRCPTGRRRFGRGAGIEQQDDLPTLLLEDSWKSSSCLPIDTVELQRDYFLPTRLRLPAQ